MIAQVVRESHSRDYWTAEAGSHAAGGSGPGEALRRLCRALNIPNADVLPLPGATIDRQTFRLGPTTRCPDCGGSGRYVGLRAAEACETCGGCGRVAA
ncbi:hypothetical protein [Alienimonas sp. DA493]|uniref:hypothetical protein n=1 Tax=Alienimonas sp. DA493 TaxID=3373605 RepID=UPI0037547F6D